MKLIAAVILMLAATCAAAPDIPAAQDAFTSIIKKCDAQQDLLTKHEVTIGRQDEQLKAKDAIITQLKTDKVDIQRKADQQVADASSATTTLEALVIGIAGLVCLIGGCVLGIFLKEGDIAVGGAAVGLVLMSVGAGINFYARSFALFGIIGAGVFVLLFIVWLVIRSHKTQQDGVNQAGVIDMLEAAGLPAKWVTMARAAQYKLAGAFGDKMTADATGKTVAQVQDDGKAAVVAASLQPTIAPSAIGPVYASSVAAQTGALSGVAIPNT